MIERHHRADESRSDQPPRQSAIDAGYDAEFTREDWIAYLAGRETPAYAGWADNFTAMGTGLNRRDAKDAKTVERTKE